MGTQTESISMAPSALSIIEDANSPYVIVLPDDPTPVMDYAGRELQHFLREVSGVTLPILLEREAGDAPALLIGPSSRARSIVPQAELAGLEEDGVLIRTEGRDVALLGKNARGQLYSVYALLESCLGARFLTQDCTVAPKRSAVTLPNMDYRYAPPFMYREVLYFGSASKRISARQRLNGPQHQCDEETGGRIEFYPYVHSFAQLVPPEEYYEDHPEYFSLVNGKRARAAVHGQLCLTNPDVLRIATAQALRWMDENPHVTIFDISQNDGGGACECDACMAVVNEEGSQHGPILRFVNAIAEVVAEKHPGKWISTLAYSYSVKPPARAKPLDNVIIRLCHVGCYFHGFEGCAIGRDFADHLRQWSRLTRRLFIWHYCTNFAHYLAPNPNLEGLAKDIKTYAARRANGLMAQGDYHSHGGELAELRAYLSAQLLWNPDLDPMTIRVEFCNGYYGAAANAVLDFLSQMDQLGRRSDVHRYYVQSDPHKVIPAEFVATGLDILSHARADAAQDPNPEVVNRIEKLFLPLWYMQLSWPERYGLTASGAAAVVGEFTRVVKANDISLYREAPNMIAWIDLMALKYGAPRYVNYE